MNTTVLTLTQDYKGVSTGAFAVCSVVNRSATNKVYVDLLDETGADTYELAGQGDKVDIDLTGARSMTIRASAYPTDILLNLTNQRATLASPSMDVLGGLNAVSPLPVSLVSVGTPTFFDFETQGSDPAAPIGAWRMFAKAGGMYVEDASGNVYGPFQTESNEPAASSALIIAECNSPIANGASATAQPFDTFYDQSGTKIGTGAPTDAAVIAALATIGLSVDAGGTIFTVTASGLYALTYAFSSVSPTVNNSQIFISGSSHSGFAYYAGPTTQIPAAVSAYNTSYGYTDALIPTNTFQLCSRGTLAETDLSYGVLGLVRVR